MSLYSKIGKELLFKFDAEQAHGLSIRGLKTGLHPRFDAAADPRLAVQVAGLNFANPLGMAAGYDKNGDVPDALLALGFGHTEVGTVTPLPQPGNPKPRIFRLKEDEAVINRLGFNSKGHGAALAQLENRKGRNGIVGINIGANKTSEDFGGDYVKGIEAFGAIADYFTVNISSPNTPGLRALQGADPLTDLLQRVDEAVEATKRKTPVFLKVAPDLNETEIDDIAKAVLGSNIDALIVSNTTLARVGLKSSSIAQEAGGLSGVPLFERSTIVLAKAHERLQGKVPLVGVGGVHNVETAWQKIEAGASLVQLYTGLVYEGPTLPEVILTGLSKRLSDEGLSSIKEICGRNADEWAKADLLEA